MPHLIVLRNGNRLNKTKQTNTQSRNVYTAVLLQYALIHSLHVEQCLDLGNNDEDAVTAAGGPQCPLDSV